MGDQVKHVRGGKLITQLDPVPNPAVPLPPQLSTFRMPFPIRPPFMPMMVRPPSVGFDQAPGARPSHDSAPRPPHDTVPRPPTGPNPPGALVSTII